MIDGTVRKTQSHQLGCPGCGRVVTAVDNQRQVDVSTPLGDVCKMPKVVGGHVMVMGYNRMKEFMRRSAGIDVENSDMERLTDPVGRKLNGLLVIGVHNASYNNRG